MQQGLYQVGYIISFVIFAWLESDWSLSRAWFWGIGSIMLPGMYVRIYGDEYWVSINSKFIDY